VIVVRTERNVGVLQLRIRSWNDADDVVGELCADDSVVGVDVDRQRHVLEREGGNRILTCRMRLQF
jgi:hypothetical protein